VTIREAREYVDRWKNRMDLSDWTIATRWGTKAEMIDEKGDFCLGYCDWDHENKTAKIRLARNRADTKHTIRHELVHLVLEGHREQPKRYVKPFETAIDRLSTAFK